MANSKALEALISIAGQVDPSLQKSLTSATNSFSGITKAAKITAAVTAAGMAAATAATIKAVSSAADYQENFQKTATLLTGTKDELEQYSDSILELSNSTGVAASELTDTVYQAISAGIDQSDAVSFAGEAAKLAAGGFTDASTAVDVMTTAINAYGLSADDATEISDYLITTQNLGKTTVDELASSVGKVIPIASAYGVQMDDLSTAYAQLTANGIDTAEAGTYLKSMLNELGDSSSDVSAILMEQTGKSFSELEESGDSLGDILGIIGDSVGNDSGAFNELWSSTEAGTGALSLLNSGAADYDDTLAKMQDSAGATDDAYNTVNDTLNHQIEVIKTLGQNFMISLGNVALPYVQEFAEDAIPGIQDAMEKVIPVVATFAENEIPKLVAGFHTVEPVAIAVFKGVGGAISTAADVTEALYGGIEETLGFLSTHSNVVVVLAGVIGTLTAAIIAETIASNAAAIASGFETAAIGTYLFVTGAATVATAAFGAVMAFVTSPITLIILAIGALITIGILLYKNWDLVTEKASELGQTIVSIASSVSDVFSSVFSGLVGIVAAPINDIIALVNGAIEAVNGLSIDVPDWVPVYGGKHFGFDIPEIPMLASGGFTDGVSIAGEAGTEAVISFDPAYRSQNLSYWAQAGQMLGASDSDILSLVEDAAGSDGTTEYNLNGVSYSPQITIQGNASKQDVLAALKEAESEFEDMLDMYMARKRRGAYGGTY